LFWREQNIREAEAIADRSDNALDALSQIMDSDLSADQKHRLAESIADGSGITNPDDSEDDGNGDSGWSFDDILGGDLQETIVMIVVLLVVVAFAVNYASNIGRSAVSGGGN
jgi:hypothetical protein